MSFHGRIWRDIEDVVIKTLVCAHSQNRHAYTLARKCRDVDVDVDAARSRTHPAANSCCFQLFGFDIFLDKQCRPYVIEVNRSPSYGTTSPLDHRVKSQLIKSTFKLLNVGDV